MGKPTICAMTGRIECHYLYIWIGVLLMLTVPWLLMPRARGQEVPDVDQEQAIARILELGGMIFRDEAKPGKPVIFVTFTGTMATDRDLALLTTLPELRV